MIQLRRIKEKLREEMHAETDLHALSAGFAVGVFISFTPLLFLHTGLALLIAFIFRLSKVGAVAGAWVNNPYTIPFVFYGCTKFGAWLLGVQVKAGWLDTWDLKTIHDRARPMMAPLFLGTTIVGVAAAGVAYVIVYHVALRIKSAHRKAKHTQGGDLP